MKESIGRWSTPKQFRRNPNRVRRYSMWPEDEREICRSCDKIIQELQGKPIHMLGWLRGGVDTERMVRLKAQYEGI